MPLLMPVLLAGLLFCLGVYGVLARRNAVLVLMSVELMLNAVNINLVAFDVWLRDALLAGQVFTLFVITIAAAEVGLGLAIILLVFRQRATTSLDELTQLHEPAYPGTELHDHPLIDGNHPPTGGGRPSSPGGDQAVASSAPPGPPRAGTEAGPS
jgi:NADH-quinone oxidoreductase subunit K